MLEPWFHLRIGIFDFYLFMKRTIKMRKTNVLTLYHDSNLTPV